MLVHVKCCSRYVAASVAASFVRNYACSTSQKTGNSSLIISRNGSWQPFACLKMSKFSRYQSLSFVCELKTIPFHSSNNESLSNIESACFQESDSDDNAIAVPTVNDDEKVSENNVQYEGEYDLEKLLDNIRHKASDRHDKAYNKVRRDIHSLMTIDELTKFLHAENANDICVIRVPPEKRYVDYLVVCSGSTTKHIGRMASALASEMRHVRINSDHDIKTDHRRVIVEGEDSNDWMAVDIGNIVVHFMLDETRQIYQIEKLWTLGHEYDDMYNEIRNYLKDDL